MKIGDKPLLEMSREELLEAITNLRNDREALRAEAAKKKVEEKMEKSSSPSTKTRKSAKPAEVEDIIKGLFNGKS